MIKLTNMKPNDWLKADTGFTCLSENAVRIIKMDWKCELYIQCDHGRHYLNGQTDHEGNLVGLTKIT